MTLSSENPFDRRFWLGHTDARIPALLRLALGAVVLVDMADRLRDFHAFYTAGGLSPSEGGWLQWSLFAVIANPWLALAVYLTGFLFAAAFFAGYRTRASNVLLWAFELTLQNRNLSIRDGGDAVVCLVLFWMMFVDAGARFSLDVRLRRRLPLASVPAVGLRFVQVQVALIYLTTFLAKSGPTWRDGTAVQLALLVENWSRGLGPVLAQHPRLCAVLTWGTLLFEAAFAPLVLSPWRTAKLRAIALVSGVIFHAGIFASMRVGVFSHVMPVSYLAFLMPAWLDRISRPAGQLSPVTSPRPILVGALGLQMALVLVEQVGHLARLSPPTVITAQLRLVGLSQDWHMFAPDGPRVDVRWFLPGVLADGRRLDLVDSTVPQLRRRAWLYSRWNRLRSVLARQNPEHTKAFGAYVCRRFNGDGPAVPLVSFELVAEVRPLLPPGEPTRQVRLRQRCR